MYTQSNILLPNVHLFSHRRKSTALIFSLITISFSKLRGFAFIYALQINSNKWRRCIKAVYKNSIVFFGHIVFSLVIILRFELGY